MSAHLENLNEKQKEAVLQTNGPVLIIAGAGAGKTKTITHRIFHLINEGVSPSSILAVTFTNKAAREMRERVLKLMEENPEIKKKFGSGNEPFVKTFHALGVHIIKQNAGLLGLPRFFGIYDKSDTKKIVKDAMVELNYDPKQIDPARIQNAISREKGNFITASEYAERAGNEYFQKVVAAVWIKYEQALKKESALDLDDLLLVTAKLLEKNESVRKYYQELWKYIHVDEYQDTNGVQYHIARMLAAGHRNLCVVGDTDQNIYSWRGADISNMLRFEKDYPEAKVILLEKNYRSTKTIIAVANDVIKKNSMRFEKNLYTENENGDKVGVFEAWSEVDEADFVAQKIESLIADGVTADEIAILYRANFQSRALEEALLSHNLPYVMVGTKFFERKEIKDILSFLRAALNPGATADVKRIVNVPARGIGPATIDKFSRGEKLAGAMDRKVSGFFGLLARIREKITVEKPSTVIKFIIKESGMEEDFKKGGEEGQDRLENALEFVSLATKYDVFFGEGEEGGGDSAIERIISDAALASNDEINEEGKNSGKGVRLMTVHASKGLEFDYVFITGLEQDLFPHQRISESGMSDEQAEEERRLFYVALTRARRKIYLTYAQSRAMYGERQVCVPSEFIGDIAAEYTELEEARPFNDRFDNRFGKKRIIEF